MPTSSSATGVGNIKYGLPLLLTLVIAGLSGNYFKLQIIYNMDVLFGSIFAMLALQFLGIGRGVLAAAMIASYTYLIWNHPYTLIDEYGNIIMTNRTNQTVMKPFARGSGALTPLGGGDQPVDTGLSPKYLYSLNALQLKLAESCSTIQRNEQTITMRERIL